jgi:hypothetical protein
MHLLQQLVSLSDYFRELFFERTGPMNLRAQKQGRPIFCA